MRDSCVVAGPEGTRHFDSYKVNSVDTSGAGDAFIGSFGVFLAEGMDETEAIRRASLYAALSTTKVGTQKSFSTREQMEEHWRRSAGVAGV